MSDDIRVPRTTIEEWIRRADSFGMVDLPYDMRALLTAPPAAQPTVETSHDWDISEGYGAAECVRCGVWAGATAAFGPCNPKTKRFEGDDFKLLQDAARDAALDTQTAQPDRCLCPQHGSWVNGEDVDRLVRELDVAWNGEDGAAKQARLCDMVSQIVSELSAPQFDSAQEVTFKTCDDDLTEEQITACRGILVYYLGGTQPDWTIGQHNEAGGYGIPLTPNEADYNGLPKNFVVDLILRTCKVFTHPPQPVTPVEGKVTVEMVERARLALLSEMGTVECCRQTYMDIPDQDAMRAVLEAALSQPVDAQGKV